LGEVGERDYFLWYYKASRFYCNESILNLLVFGEFEGEDLLMVVRIDRDMDVAKGRIKLPLLYFSK
jgi:hypothetical protein